MVEFSVLTDASANRAGDRLDFGRYLAPLERILKSPISATPLTIGVFGAWGSGKSTLLRMLAERLDPKEFVVVDFNPWVYRKEPTMLVPLLHALRDALEDTRHGARFVESARKIGAVLLRLGADAILSGLTAGSVTVEKLEQAEETYLKARDHVYSETRRLHQALQTEADRIAANGARIVLMIDDLDRCEPEQIIDVLESAKLFFDLRNVFIVLAIDKEVIDRGIQVKYSKFRFADTRESVIGAEYLEKMVQLPLLLYPLQPEQVGGLIDALACDRVKLISENMQVLQQLLPPNPRKIKRVLNILALTDAIRSGTPALAALNGSLLVRFVVLQVQNAELYSAVIALPELLIALEEVYAGKRSATKAESFNDFGERRDVVQKLCERFYQPAGPLKALFDKAGFAGAKAQLSTYLSMLAG